MTAQFLMLRGSLLAVCIRVTYIGKETAVAAIGQP
jgi:hypothetical protein